MKIASQILADGLIAGLQGWAALASIGKGRVYDLPPPLRPAAARAMPSTSIAVLRVASFSRRGLRGCSVFGTIDHWAEAGDNAIDQLEAVRAMSAATTDFLHDWSPVFPGWRLHSIDIDDAVQEIREDDGVSAHGVVPYRADLTPISPDI